MEKIAKQTLLFNSPLETGVRSVLILNAAYPLGFDLTQLTWLDHLVVHTGDISGPDSLHPDIPQRAGELVVRRSMVEEGLKLMQKLHLIDSKFTNEGILYSASEDSSLFVQLVRTSYGKALKERSEWLVKYVAKQKREKLASLINEKVGRWTIEFQADERHGAMK